jgi:hypothetical protein
MGWSDRSPKVVSAKNDAGIPFSCRATILGEQDLETWTNQQIPIEN